MDDPEEAKHQKAGDEAEKSGQSSSTTYGRSAGGWFPGSGGSLSSKVSKVMAMAKTPSLKASMRPVPTCPSIPSRCSLHILRSFTTRGNVRSVRCCSPTPELVPAILEHV